MKLNIQELKIGESFKGELLVKEAVIKQASNGPYLMVQLTDGTTNITGKRWKCDRLLAEGAVYDFVGEVGEYNGKKDINIKGSKITETPYTEFLKHGPNDSEKMYKLVDVAIGDIDDADYKNLCSTIWFRNGADIVKAPAAKSVHHDYIGGYVEHTYEVYSIAALTATSLVSVAHLDLNLSLVCAGAILHDIGKLWAYSETCGVIDLSDTGHFLEHIAYGIHYIYTIGEELNIPKSKLLQLTHCIAAHHGELEYGSPVKPVMPEAYIIHLADQASARCTMMDEIKKSATGDWSERNYFLGTSIYTKKGE